MEMMLRKWCMCGVVLLALATMAGLASATVDDPSASQQNGVVVRLDQQQTSKVTTFQIPPAGIWQSFTPSFSGNLTSIEVYLGTANRAAGCKLYDGTLAVYEGEGLTSQPYFPLSSRLQMQRARTVQCQCSEEDCMMWQLFDLSTPVPVTEAQKYSFFLSPSQGSQSFRVGLAVADFYPRGINNFVAPGYDYTFKTFVATADDTSMAPDTLEPHHYDSSTHTTEAQPPSTSEHHPIDVIDVFEKNDDSSSSKHTIVLVSAIGGTLVVMCIVAIVVMANRRRGRSQTHVLSPNSNRKPSSSSSSPSQRRNPSKLAMEFGDDVPSVLGAKYMVTMHHAPSNAWNDDHAPSFEMVDIHSCQVKQQQHPQQQQSFIMSTSLTHPHNNNNVSHARTVTKRGQVGITTKNTTTGTSSSTAHHQQQQQQQHQRNSQVPSCWDPQTTIPHEIIDSGNIHRNTTFEDVDFSET